MQSYQKQYGDRHLCVPERPSAQAGKKCNNKPHVQEIDPISTCTQGRVRSGYVPSTASRLDYVLWLAGGHLAGSRLHMCAALCFPGASQRSGVLLVWTRLQRPWRSRTSSPDLGVRGSSPGRHRRRPRRTPPPWLLLPVVAADASRFYAFPHGWTRRG